MKTSTIMPVRNGAAYIEQALRSVLCQLGADDECFVVDDGSTDQTWHIVAALGDPRIRLMRSPRSGVSAARNAALSLCTGEFVAFVDADDEWPADRHSTMLRHMLDRPEIDAVYGRIIMKFEPGAPLQAGYQDFDGAHLSTCVVSGLFRKRILDRVDGFAEDMPHSEDSDFFNRLIEAGIQFQRVDCDAYFYRRHSGNATNDLATSRRWFLEMLRRKLARARQRSREQVDEA